MTEMMKSGSLPDSVGELARKIETWRGLKTCRSSPMPAALWQEAVALAARHGAGRVASLLGLDHKKLKLRALAGSNETPMSVVGTMPSFVEVVGISEKERTEAGIELELVSIGGARLRLRHCRCGVDLAGVIEAFCRSAS